MTRSYGTLSDAVLSRSSLDNMYSSRDKAVVAYCDIAVALVDGYTGSYRANPSLWQIYVIGKCACNVLNKFTIAVSTPKTSDRNVDNNYAA